MTRSDKAPESERLFPPWGDHDLSDASEDEARIGPLTLRMRRVGSEYWLSWTEEEDGAEGAETVDDGKEAGGDRKGAGEEWSRWAAPDQAPRLRLAPVLPDRPLVVEPEQSFHLVRGAEVRIYVRVPLWIDVAVPGDPGVAITQIPSRTLSDTWFGDLSEGELSYALPTSARRAIAPEDVEPHLALCPLLLINRAETNLEVTRICLRVAHLSLFSDGSGIWADETRVRYRGDAEGSEIRMSGRAPSDAPDASRVAQPRVPIPRGFQARTFAKLAQLPGIVGGS